MRYAQAGKTIPAEPEGLREDDDALFAAIMNLPPADGWKDDRSRYEQTAYKVGHRDARHAAAELAQAASAARSEEIAALRLDAERYRFLRDNASVKTPHVFNPSDGWRFFSVGLDYLIDAARAALSPKEPS